MFELIAEKNTFFRIKDGQSARDLSFALLSPVAGDAFCGRIVKVESGSLEKYCVKPCESYKSIAQARGVSESELMALNGGEKIYPTCTILVPARAKEHGFYL